ncbi:hypothetical protein EYF80_028461 [Liparis tanakae]|uniref:Uncharacterized protein n=1 Tax=Liparis tanakae TaxID=230148 RepID=A0A4Z2H8Z4_9TELE|nr:hypothetical protein EYF80_028461 [Liparis tanakae]
MEAERSGRSLNNGRSPNRAAAQLVDGFKGDKMKDKYKGGNLDQGRGRNRDYNQHDIQCKNYNSYSAVQVGQGCCTAELDEADEPARELKIGQAVGASTSTTGCGRLSVTSTQQVPLLQQKRGERRESLSQECV